MCCPMDWEVGLVCVRIRGLQSRTKLISTHWPDGSSTTSTHAHRGVSLGEEKESTRKIVTDVVKRGGIREVHIAGEVESVIQELKPDDQRVDER